MIISVLQKDGITSNGIDTVKVERRLFAQA